RSAPHHGREHIRGASGTRDRARGSLQIAGDVLLFDERRRRWWPDGVRRELSRSDSARRELRRPNIEGRQGFQSSGRAADQVRVQHQPEDREDARLDNSARRACHRGQGDRMRRRAFITLLGGAAAALPLAAPAQQPGKPPTIGYLGTTTASAWGPWTAAFVQRLDELGWTEGRTIATEYRWTDGRSERFAEIATEFVLLKVDVIVTGGNAAVAAKQATSVIPIVFVLGGPGWHRPDRESGATGWQHHRPDEPATRSCWQATRNFARSRSQSSPVGDHGQC